MISKLVDKEVSDVALVCDLFDEMTIEDKRRIEEYVNDDEELKAYGTVSE